MNKNIFNKIMDNLSKDYEEMRLKKSEYLTSDHLEYIQVYNDIYAAKIIVSNHFHEMEYTSELIMKVTEMCREQRLLNDKKQVSSTFGNLDPSLKSNLFGVNKNPGQFGFGTPQPQPMYGRLQSSTTDS